MPSRTLLLCVLGGVAVVAALIFSGIFATRGGHIELTGHIVKVRTAALEAKASAAIMDMRINNPADFPFVVKSFEIVLTTADGRELQGRMLPEVDAAQVFAATPALGQKFNDSLRYRERLKPHQEVDRMVAAYFEAPVTDLDTRRSLKLSVLDADGAVAEFDAPKP